MNPQGQPIFSGTPPTPGAPSATPNPAAPSQPNPQPTPPQPIMSAPAPTPAPAGGYYPSYPQQKSKKLIIAAIAVLIVMVIFAIVIFILVNSNKNKNPEVTLFQTDLAAIFDESAPIPKSTNSKYSYIDAKSGETIIPAKYDSATQFYGNYALVTNGSGKKIIINRKGEEKLVQDSASYDFGYDIDNSIWFGNGNIYDGNLQQINPEGSRATYIGNGYILLSTASETKEADKDNASSSSTTGTSEKNSIIDRTGTTIVDCAGVCAATTLVGSDGVIYAILRNWGQASSVVNLSSGETIYTASGKNSISVGNNGSLIEKNSEGKSVQLKLQDGKVSAGTTTASLDPTVSQAGEYKITRCETGLYQLKNVSGETVTDCNIQSYTEFSKNTYMYYLQTKQRHPIILTRDSATEIFDMKTAKIVQKFDLSEATTYEDSPFIALKDLKNQKLKVCNLFKNNCTDIDDINSTVKGYSNYFTIENSGTTKTYNANMTELK